MICKLVYTVTIDTSGNTYYLYIKNTHLKSLQLPTAITDIIQSQGVILPPKIKQLDDIAPYITTKLRDAISSIWEWNYGVPVIRYTGKVSSFHNIYKNTNILPFFLQKHKDVLEQCTYWYNSLSELTNFLLFYSEGDDGQRTLIGEHELARAMIKRTMRCFI